MPTRFLTLLLWSLTLLGALTACMFFYQAIHYSNNSPIGEDDISLIVSDTISMINAHTFFEWLTPFMHQNAEHRPAMLRILAMLSYVLLDVISLPFINIASAILLVAGVFTILRSVTPSRVERLWMAAWALPLAVAPLHYECIPWASCSASHYTVIAFGCIALYFATKRGWWSFLAFELASVMALLSLFSGLMTLVLGGVAIWLRPESATAKRQFLYLHIALTVLMLGLYMIDLDLIYKYLPMEAAHFNADPMGTVQNALIWFFAWLGAWLNLFRDVTADDWRASWTLKDIPVPWVAVGIGAAELLGILLLIFRYRQALLTRHLHLSLSVIYLLSTIGVAAMQRSMVLSFPFIYTSRYQVYTLFLVISILALCFALLREYATQIGSDTRYKLCIAGVSATCLLFYMGVYRHLGYHISENYAVREQCITDWNMTGEAGLCGLTGDIKAILDTAINTNLFRIEH